MEARHGPALHTHLAVGRLAHERENPVHSPRDILLADREDLDAHRRQRVLAGGVRGERVPVRAGGRGGATVIQEPDREWPDADRLVEPQPAGMARPAIPEDAGATS